MMRFLERRLFRTLVKINNATVTKADINASNGVIHIIDTVLMPPSTGAQDIVKTIQSNPDLSTLATAVGVLSPAKEFLKWFSAIAVVVVVAE